MHRFCDEKATGTDLEGGMEDDVLVLLFLAANSSAKRTVYGMPNTPGIASRTMSPLSRRDK